MIKLHLNVGDRVRNIFRGVMSFGWVGVVSEDKGWYRVIYDNGETLTYPKEYAHEHLEKVTEPVTGNNPAMTWADLKDMPPSQLHKYGAGADYTWLYHADFAKLEGIVIADTIMKAQEEANKATVMSMANAMPPRHVLKRVRRNVLTGWTQDELVAQYGHAKGVTNFNTRAMGKTTGQVLACIAEAINNPGKPVVINGVDHARARPGNSTSWTTLNKHFLATIEATIDKLDLKGFTVEPKKGIMTFNPIVVEETYVEVHNAR